MLILVIGGSPGIVAAGAVDQNVTGAQIGQNSLMDSFQSLGIQDVGLVAFHDEAFGLHFFGQLLDGVLVQVQSSDLGAALSESAGHSAADQAAGAGDDDDFTGVIDVQRQIDHDNYAPFL